MTAALAGLALFLLVLVLEARRTIQRLQSRVRDERRARRALEDERRLAGSVRLVWSREERS
jgi:hypothetical protein